ncbi:MAG: glutamine-synthetase adenylyltransferase, partial [Rhodospirillales bacterium]|nr:glutamine-synthetase adenylyltransferase [Rhodospirillales bacterium]
VAAVTAPGIEGRLYEVDMRLRPSGNKGPVAVSLASFQRYHADDAWTWERMALTRARVVAGPPALRRRVEAAIRAGIASAGAPARIRADAAAMRARMLRDLPAHGPWDVKLPPGGQVEVEFVAQTLQLVHARAHPALPSPTIRVALARLGEAGLLDGDDARTLIAADRLWRTIQGMLRITYGRWPTAELSPAAMAALLAAIGVPDHAALQARMAATAAAVRDCFVRLVGPV